MNGLRKKFGYSISFLIKNNIVRMGNGRGLIEDPYIRKPRLYRRAIQKNGKANILLEEFFPKVYRKNSQS